MDKIDVKKDVRYVAAMMADVPMFIAHEIKSGIRANDSSVFTFALTDNITAALKSTDKDTMREVIRQYSREHSIHEQFTILPIEITYRIIDYEG